MADGRSRMGLIILKIVLLNACCRLTARAWNSSDLCGTDVAWSYEPVSGKCWTLPSDVIANTTELISWEDAAAKCDSLGSDLPAPRTVADLTGMQRFLTANGLAVDVWTQVTRLTGLNDTNFYYPGGNSTVPIELWFEGRVPGASNLFDCAVYTSREQPLVGGGWTRLMGFRVSQCSSVQATVCCKNVTQCQATDLTDLNLATMTAMNISYGPTQLTNLFNIGLRSDVQCNPGYFRSRDSPVAAIATPAPTSEGLAVNQVECFQGSGAGAAPVLRSNSIEACQKATCPTTYLRKDSRIPNVEAYDQYVAKDYYNFEESFPLNCSLGYVSYLNQSSVNSYLSCSYSVSDHTRYEWVPPDLNACQPVACPPVQSIIREYMTAFKAFDRLNEKEYNEFQLSSFAYYPNRVYIKCTEVGTFFDDRTFTKVASCDLKNGSLIEGAWYGVLGTSLSRLSATTCVPVSCQSDELITKSSAGAEFLAGLSYTNLTGIEFVNGTKIVMETGSVNSIEFYTYGTVIQFSCVSGSSTGIGQPVVMCTDTGSWNLTRLPTCTKTSETLVPKGKHYVPPSVEAQGADSIGAIAIIVCIIFAVFIVILDLSTLSRDLMLIRRNIRGLKRRMNEGKRPPVSESV